MKIPDKYNFIEPGEYVNYHSWIGGPVTEVHLKVIQEPTQRDSSASWLCFLEKKGLVSCDALSPEPEAYKKMQHDLTVLNERMIHLRKLLHPLVKDLDLYLFCLQNKQPVPCMSCLPASYQASLQFSSEHEPGHADILCTMCGKSVTAEDDPANVWNQHNTWPYHESLIQVQKLLFDVTEENTSCS